MKIIQFQFNSNIDPLSYIYITKYLIQFRFNYNIALISYFHSDQMCGICGNMNNIEDDYFTSDGTDVSTHPNKYNLIGDSWQVAGGE